MRIISFDGRLGSDAEVKTTRDGKPYVRLHVANNIYTNGEDRTDWFDVTCYDQFVVEKRAKFFTKGTYVIVTGNVVTEVKPYEGKLWVNHYVTATSIDLPRFGRSQNDSAENSEAPAVSVYTADTRSSVIEPAAPAVAPTPEPAPSIVTTGDLPSYAAPDFSNDDDLPF